MNHVGLKVTTWSELAERERERRREKKREGEKERGLETEQVVLEMEEGTSSAPLGNLGTLAIVHPYQAQTGDPWGCTIDYMRITTESW
jgi:hypothetical protein